MNTERRIELDDLQEILAVLAKIIAKGLSVEQRDAVMRGLPVVLGRAQASDEYQVFRALQSVYDSQRSIEYVVDITRRIESTRSFYQDVGPNLDRLKYLLTKQKVTTQGGSHPPYVFVLIPFSAPFLAVYERAIRPCLEQIGCEVMHAEEASTLEAIIDVIFKNIGRADFLIADTTGGNPNVFYEIGYAHARGKKVLLLTQDTKAIPFDLAGIRHLKYSPNALHALEEDLRTCVRRLINGATFHE
jgi:hypothetical protein